MFVDKMQEAAMDVVDWWYERGALPELRDGVLDSCRLISHRGEHDNQSVFENTLPALQQAMDAGVWGDRKSTRLNSSHSQQSRMPSSA